MIFAKKVIVLFFVCLFLGISVYAQGELADDRESTKYNVNQYGIKVNSNGFGALYTFAQRVNYRLRRNYEIEYDYIKNLKEVKMQNTTFSSYRSGIKKFVFGKVNSVHNIRVGYGYNWMLFEKRDKNSVSIHLQANAGFTFAFEKPIYYVMIDSVEIFQDRVYYYVDTCQFDEYYSGRAYDIVTRAPFYKGLNEIKVRPGNYVKLDLSFDFARDAMAISAIEVGAIFDYYYMPVTIMHNQPKNFMWSLYIAYQFGSKYNPMLNREFRREQRKAQK